MFATGKIEIFTYFYLFVIMHELSHILVALILKIDVKEIELLPIGITAKYERNNSLVRELIISLAGPLASFLFTYLFNSETYKVMNFAIAIFNLVPIYPLDGGRIIRCLCGILFGKFRGKKISLVITKIFFIILVLLSLAMAAFSKNYYPIILVFYIFYIVKEEINKEEFYGIINYLQIDE